MKNKVIDWKCSYSPASLLFLIEKRRNYFPTKLYINIKILQLKMAKVKHTKLIDNLSIYIAANNYFEYFPIWQQFLPEKILNTF